MVDAGDLRAALAAFLAAASRPLRGTLSDDALALVGDRLGALPSMGHCDSSDLRGAKQRLAPPDMSHCEPEKFIYYLFIIIFILYYYIYLLQLSRSRPHAVHSRIAVAYATIRRRSHADTHSEEENFRLLADLY